MWSDKNFLTNKGSKQMMFQFLLLCNRNEAAICFCSDSVGQEFRQDTVGRACHCSTMSGASAQKTWRLEVTQWLDPLKGWDDSNTGCADQSITPELSVRPGLPHSLATSELSDFLCDSSGLWAQMSPLAIRSCIAFHDRPRKSHSTTSFTPLVGPVTAHQDSRRGDVEFISQWE